jgi:uncharacterized membrane protein
MTDGNNEKTATGAETVISRVLQAGVFVSALIILIGLVMYLASGKSGYPGASFPSDPAAVIQGLFALKPYAVMLFGLFLLILTPVLRVGISIIIFIIEKDRLYIAITAIVFTILIISFLLGKAQ